MQNVKVEKAELVGRIKANRDVHRQVFEKAMEGYRRAAAEFFNEQWGNALDDRQFAVVFRQPVPEDHSDDYEAALDMLEMSVEDRVTLSAQEFRQYVRDDWGWKKNWTETTSSYVYPDES